MVIDVITFKDEQFASLTESQLLEVKDVQRQKNRLTEKLAEEKRKEKYRLLTAGVYRSPIYEKICEKLDRRYEEEVEQLRAGLLFFLRFGQKGEGDGEGSLYELDYTLSYEDRYEIVKEYYNANYTDEKERFEEFKKDRFAPAYLGEFYSVLYDYFYLQAEKE